MIKLENVTKVYRVGKAEIRALDRVDLAIDDGEMIVITGPSGAGKTTLMNILGCLDVPTSGRYLLDGADVSQLSERRLAKIRSRKIGFVFQSPNLVARTSAIRNVELPLIYAGVHARGPAQQAWEQVGLGDQQKHLPPELSVGQRHQVAIARALINDPVLLLAEEPTGELDTTSSAEIMTFLRGLTDARRTVVVTTHRRDVVQFAMRVMRMRDGRIVSDQKQPAGPAVRQQPKTLNG
ncbi:MAG: ABC transporter ATP-binding protein [Pseudonocardiales bacterium]|nr:ABC transporter ATP-binding protein [Pseudonocardiales bacterium]